jgi:hypothetical protein
MEMARAVIQFGKLRGAALGVLLALAAGGCGKAVCPAGLRPDDRRSKPGVTTFCESPTDKSRAAFVDLYPDGARRQICPFLGGRPGGAYQAFHPNGARWLEGRYENGRKVGRWTQWSPDGRKVADGEYREGQTVEGAPVGFPASCERIAW